MSKWSTSQLKEFILGILAERDKATGIALAAQKEAILKAENSVDKRLEGMNEFRKTLSDQAAHFIPREEALQRIDALSERVSALSKSNDQREGSGANWQNIATIVSIGVAIAAVIVAIIHH